MNFLLDRILNSSGKKSLDFWNYWGFLYLEDKNFQKTASQKNMLIDFVDSFKNRHFSLKKNLLIFITLNSFYRKIENLQKVFQQRAFQAVIMIVESWPDFFVDSRKLCVGDFTVIIYDFDDGTLFWSRRKETKKKLVHRVVFEQAIGDLKNINEKREYFCLFYCSADKPMLGK